MILLSLQMRVFDAVVALGRREGLPLIVHSRGAWGLTLDRVLRARAETGLNIMIHCYGGPAQDVRRLTDAGILLGFGGVPTWHKARKVREAFLVCPDDHLLVETDAPESALGIRRRDATRAARARAPCRRDGEARGVARNGNRGARGPGGCESVTLLAGKIGREEFIRRSQPGIGSWRGSVDAYSQGFPWASRHRAE